MQVVFERDYFDAIDFARVMVRQLPGAPEADRDLDEAKAHEIGAERNGEIDDPHRDFEIGRRLIRLRHSEDERGAEAADDSGEYRPGGQSEEDELGAHARWQVVDEHVDADMDPRAH